MDLLDVDWRDVGDIQKSIQVAGDADIGATIDEGAGRVGNTHNLDRRHIVPIHTTDSCMTDHVRHAVHDRSDRREVRKEGVGRLIVPERERRGGGQCGCGRAHEFIEQ